jgi:hypothetical protein
MVIDAGAARIETSESALQPRRLPGRVDLTRGEEAVKLKGGLGEERCGEEERE